MQLKRTCRLALGLVAGLLHCSGLEAGSLKLVAETAAERDARMAWWREARFGMFLHWGLYSGLAGTWKGERVPAGRGGLEWTQWRVKATAGEYLDEALPRFRPAPDFAKAWACIAKQAGCKYVVFTSKHHDGFAMHDSSFTTYDAMDLIGRDLCREIVTACRAEGLKIGLYHSLIDWHHPQYEYKLTLESGMPHPLEEQDYPNGPRNHELYLKYLHRQAEELMTHYGTIDIIWWDYSKGEAEGEFWRADELMAMVRKYQPAIVSNNRLYRTDAYAKSADEGLKSHRSEFGDFTTPEQHIPDTGIEGVDWEVCMTMNGTWGYSEHDQDWKSAEELIHKLIDIVSKGGNYLLNIGPKGDGSIPRESIDAMQAIGRWMAVNNEAIYGTQASPFESPAWGRYTKKDGQLFAHVFEWPEDGALVIPVKVREISRATLLVDPSTELKIEADGNQTRITLPVSEPDAIASVIKLEYNL